MLSVIRITAVPVAVLLLAAAWIVYWFILSDTMKQEYRTALDRLQQEQGVMIDCQDAVWGGFPFRITLDCSNPRIRTLHPRRLEAAAEMLTIMMQAYDRRHFIARIEGPTRVSIEDRQPVSVTHGTMIASLVTPRDEPGRFAAEVGQIAVEGLGSAGRLIVNGRFMPEENSTVSARLTDMALTEPRPLKLDELGAAVSLSLPLALESLASPSSGGIASRIEVQHLEARRGEIRLTGEGQISFNSGRPEGEILTSVNDIDGLMAIITEQAALREAEAGAVKQLLKLLSAGSAGRQIPLIIREGTIYWGPFAILSLSPS